MYLSKSDRVRDLRKRIYDLKVERELEKAWSETARQAAADARKKGRKARTDQKLQESHRRGAPGWLTAAARVYNHLGGKIHVKV